MNRNYLYGLLVTLVLLVVSCQKIPEIKKVSLSEESVYAFPLSKIDIADKVIVTKDPYKVSLNAITYSYATGTTATADTSYPSATTYDEQSQSIDVVKSGVNSLISSKNVELESLDEADINSGTLTLSLSYTSSSEIEFVFEVPQITDVQGNPFVQNMTLPKGNSQTKSVSVDIAGYKIKPRNNSIDFKSKVRVKVKQGDAISVFSVTPSLEMTPYELFFVKGRVKDGTLDFPEQTIDFEEALGQYATKIGSKAEEKELSINVVNKYGVPFRVDLSNIVFLYKDGSYQTLSGPISELQNQDAIIREATLDGGKVVPKSTRISFNSTNSNIADLINENLVSIDLNSKLFTALGDNTPSSYHFFYLSGYNKGSISATVQIRIPFKLLDGK